MVSIEDVINEYVDVHTAMKKLEVRNEELRQMILTAELKGEKFENTPIVVKTTKKFNMEATKKKMIKEGLKIPMVIVPAREVEDVDLLTKMAVTNKLAVYEEGKRVEFRK